MDRRRPPLGATWDGVGVHFALLSEEAHGIDLCLFEGPESPRESSRTPLVHAGDGFWRAYVRGIGPGQVYGFRARGPYDPARGLRFNPAKLLLDPRARAICGRLDCEGPIAGFRPSGAAARADHTPDPRDSAPHVPRSVVTDPLFDWGRERPPRTPWHRTVIYECHVKGLTARHPGVPEPLRGTFLGLACEPVIDHLRSLGVTAVELLPVQHRLTEPRLARRGLENYWGYNTIGFFAPDARFATGETGGQVAEFKQMVRALHRAGIEVLLDVVYNHTAEGGHDGPTLCMRGLDNRSWYRLRPDDPRRYEDLTGCGNTLDLRRRATRDFVLESLRFWALEMRVDGFRFDLAPVLLPEGAPSIFEEMIRDPVLGRCKLVAEPWDLSGRGDFLGRFPPGFAEWNGRYRDAVRRFWRGDPGAAAELATRIAGSSDLYRDVGRSPQASINYVTCHDGFTLADLVSYERKHNEANGEENRDGTDDNLSGNWGAEGPTTDARVLGIRRRMQRNLLATLLLSQGVPMISGGDEIGRTQGGNNNAYCQDGEVTWFDWNLGRRRRELLRFTREMIRLRRDNPVLRRLGFFLGREIGPTAEKDILWFRPDGGEMTPADWEDPGRRVLGMRIPGYAADERGTGGGEGRGETLLALLNAGPDPVRFALPHHDRERPLEVRLHTGSGGPPGISGGGVTIEGRSLALLAPKHGWMA